MIKRIICALGSLLYLQAKQTEASSNAVITNYNCAANLAFFSSNLPYDNTDSQLGLDLDYALEDDTQYETTRTDDINLSIT